MDKIFRLKNTIIDNPGIADPEDAWLDLLGYAILGVLTNRGYFIETGVEFIPLHSDDEPNIGGSDWTAVIIQDEDPPMKGMGSGRNE